MCFVEGPRTTSTHTEAARAQLISEVFQLYLGTHPKQSALSLFRDTSF